MRDEDFKLCLVLVTELGQSVDIIISINSIGIVSSKWDGDGDGDWDWGLGLGLGIGIIYLQSSLIRS